MIGTAEERSGSDQDLWTATTREDHEEAHFCAFVAHNMKEHGQDRSRWNRLDPRTKKRKELRRIGRLPLSFREHRSQQTGCWVCYGKGNNHAHDHRHCKVYEDDGKTYFTQSRQEAQGATNCRLEGKGRRRGKRPRKGPRERQRKRLWWRTRPRPTREVDRGGC